MNRAALRKRRRMLLLGAGFLVLSLAVFLVLTALEDNIRLFYDPTEVQERALKPGQAFRLGGLVAVDSFHREDKGGILVNHFTITDGNARVDVRYQGLLPDLFREGQGVVTDGALDDSGLFIATEVLAKHDENYMPKEVIDSLKKRGQWQEKGKQEKGKNE